MGGNVRATKHGKERTKERLGLSKKAAEKQAQKAMTYGVKQGEARGRLQRYMDGLYLSHNTGNNNRIYNRKVYIFRGVVLITVMNLPKNLSAIADKIQKEKKEGLEKQNEQGNTSGDIHSGVSNEQYEDGANCCQ